jgi:hypothetical protein
MFNPALVEVIMAFTTRDGDTFRKRIRKRFKRLTLTPESCAVNQRFTGNI